MATIGRLSGVADIRWLGRLGRMSGFTAWLMWLSVHIVYLIGLANRDALDHRATAPAPIKRPERPDRRTPAGATGYGFTPSVLPS